MISILGLGFQWLDMQHGVAFAECILPMSNVASDLVVERLGMSTLLPLNNLRFVAEELCCEIYLDLIRPIRTLGKTVIKI